MANLLEAKRGFDSIHIKAAFEVQIILSNF